MFAKHKHLIKKIIIRCNKLQHAQQAHIDNK